MYMITGSMATKSCDHPICCWLYLSEGLATLRGPNYLQKLNLTKPSSGDVPTQVKKKTFFIILLYDIKHLLW